MLQNPCKLIVPLDQPDNIVKCEGYMENVIQQGMTVAFTRHFENMKEMERLYWYYKGNPDAPFIYPADEAGGKDMSFRKVYPDNQNNNIVNILNLPIAFEANWFQQEYC